MGNKKQFLSIITKQGISSIKQKIREGKISVETPVNIESELATAKQSIGTQAVSLNITDDDLRGVIRAISKACGLKIGESIVVNSFSDESVKVVEPEASKPASAFSKDILLAGIANELMKMAQKNISKKILDPNKPYDLKVNAARLIRAWRRNFATGMALRRFSITDEELTSTIRNVLVALNFKEIVE